MTHEEPRTFEEAFAALQEVLSALETGTPTLDETVALYEKGMRLANLCEKLLEEAELRIRTLETEHSLSQSNQDGE
nr:exodeoxyribonuclease VII small subunit [Ardenticatena sp.]